jgi:hypothetical protein
LVIIVVIFYPDNLKNLRIDIAPDYVDIRENKKAPDGARSSVRRCVEVN